MSKSSLIVVHDSTKYDAHNKYGFKKGQKTPLGKIINVNFAGEVVFSKFDFDAQLNVWDYDYELAELWR